VGKFATFSEGPKAKKCFSFRGASPPDSLTRGSAPDPAGLRPRPPIIGASHLYLGGL